MEVVGNREGVDLDVWNGRPVEMRDSEIDEWKKHCEVLREKALTCLSRRRDGL